MNIKETLLEAYNFRHACKLFDHTKKITDEDFNFILETARLSPTSFGMEGVRLTVITNDDLKKELKPFCWNQNQIDSCSHLVVFKTKTKELKPYSEWTKAKFAERGLPQEAQDKYMEVYANFHKSLKSDDIYEWGTRQAYILFSSIITSAALLKIDSCPIEGFEKENLEKVLKINADEEEVSLVCAFGYREHEQPTKHRLPLEEICEYIK
ncbi:NAD(P)H-dependent oxidoreductase [Sulfurimonas marina]|uniref:NAD(P)H-dependent oxidoreductase n=1 Tax=Sulfurimonas marina TaxID=2590551 RepID=UPI001D054C40|nr:NAD(P)H-dependent oxidoreductase [Sulfurimonas marina]